MCPKKDRRKGKEGREGTGIEGGDGAALRGKGVNGGGEEGKGREGGMGN